MRGFDHAMILSSSFLHCIFRENDYYFNNSTMADKCISCNQTVTTRQQAIQCEEEIEPMFQRLQRHASEPLQQYTEYVNNTWINGTWGPTDWTAFKKAIRTNNEAEG